MKKQIIVVGILIVFLFAGVIGVNIFLLNQESKEVLEAEESEVNEPTSEEKIMINEEVDEIIEEDILDVEEKKKSEIVEELYFCNNLQDLYMGNATKCYAEVAIKADNYLVCKRLADKNGLFAPGWIPNCFALIAVEKNDKQVCDLIDEVDFYSWPRYREQCYWFVEKGEVGSWMVE